MSLVEDMLSVLDEGRGLMGEFGLIPSQLTIRTRTWSGLRRDVGTATDVDLVLPPRYEVREVNGREIMSSGGEYTKGDVRVGPITPKNATSGYTPDELKPVGAKGIEIIYIITGPLAGDYRLLDLSVDDPFGYVLTLRRMHTTP
jgi:hypothetical protein